MNHGDWRTWMRDDLYRNLSRVIEGKQGFPVPYYIQVQIAKNYTSPAVANAKLETTEVALTGSHIYGVRLVVMDKKPIIPQLGTILWRVDNRTGEVALEYALPADRPNDVHDSDNYGEVVGLVGQTAERMNLPLIWN